MSSIASPTTLSVLHVDDDPEFADLTATFLEREDEEITVMTARTADEGLAMLTETDVDCIVSDYDMPGQSGIDLLRTVQDSHPDLPFILYTGKGSEEVASDAISAGVTDYLQKGPGTDQYTVLANRIKNAVEHHRSQQELAARNQELRRYERMLNSMGEAACIYDADGCFEFVNEYLADWYGTTGDALEGQQSNLIPYTRAHADGDPYQELLDGDRSALRGEVEAEFPRHGYSIVAYQLTPLIVEESIEGVVGVARDITDRKEREQELARRKRAMDEAPSGITITDPAQEDNPVIYANKKFRELTGYAEHEIRGRNCRFLQGDATRSEPVAAMREAVDAEESVTVELRNYRKDGSEFWSRVSIAPVRDDDGELRNFVGFQQDITDQRQRQEELKRKNARLERFASVVSHDLRNPLHLASGRLELARQETESAHHEAIEDALDRMDRIIEDMLWLARENKEISAPSTVALQDAVESGWLMATGDLDESDLVIEPRRGDELGTIQADYERLCQLLENLFGNAVKHGGEDVTVTVGEFDDGFYVADDGPGIPAAERDDVFTAGYTTADDGTGFGLHIVEQIADAHGWDVHIRSGGDGGVRFAFTGVDVQD